MRVIATIIFCTVLATTCAGPEPKKYKPDIKDRDKKENSTLTEEERKFLREVEEKFGIKTTELDNSKDDQDDKTKHIQGQKMPFPAVIAIEIVNDTDTKAKDKRTIDANLGYGYKTNKGYTYSYFGKPSQEKGKFMIYPYSQEDIPTPSHHNHNGASINYSVGKYTTAATNVEIQPSQAFELVAVKDVENSYPYKKPITDFKANYNNIKGLVSPPQPYPHTEHSQDSVSASPPSTLYTTYNGEGFSGLSGQFPTVMPNYFVDPTQLLKQPEYQSVGLTNDHLHSLQGANMEQRVVPVLVLRVPSSSLKNPTAELFANLPDNYPLSQYLNSVNLQELVNQYFKKIGYTFAPQVKTYQESLTLKPAEAPAAASVPSYEPQHYAAPYVQPSYTQADYSGVQYSAVKPVMARYPSSYTRQQYHPYQSHSLYRQPTLQHQYQYQYIPKSAVPTQTYYVQPQYQQQSQPGTSHESEHEHSSINQETSLQDTSTEVEYEIPSQVISHETRTFDYRNPQTDVEANYESETASPGYGVPKENTETVSSEYDTSKIPVYGPPKEESGSQEYYTERSPEQKEALAIYPTQTQSQSYYSQSDVSGTQNYAYQQSNEDSSNDLVLTENYPDKDHTIATVLPLSYKSRKPSGGAIQTVSYVTPMPYSYKYQSPYRVMVPQTFLKNPVAEKVSYVNSHSMSSHAQIAYQPEHNPEAEYTVGPQYIPPIGKQKPPSYPRNYHSHPKRMIRPENKPESNKSLFSKKQNDRDDKKKSSSV